MPTYLTRAAARTYLEETHGIPLGATALDNMASDGTGPTYARIAGRALYTREWLDSWVTAQASRPVARRNSEANSATAAQSGPSSKRSRSVIPRSAKPPRRKHTRAQAAG
jgi:hypothetical protein